MSVLPAGNSLEQQIPDLDELLRDPIPYLAAGPVTLGPRRMYGPAALFLLVGIGLFASFAFIGDTESTGERIALGIGLTLGGFLWLGWSLALSGHQLVIRADGIEVKHRDSTVWCPWALFNADGEPFVPNTDSPLVGLTMPINPPAVAYIEQRQNEAPVAHGVQIKAKQVSLASGGEIIFPARYEVKAEELGFLLQHLGRRLGRELPRGTPPAEAAGTVDDEPLQVDGGGWVICRLSQLKFPPICCNCGARTTQLFSVPVESRFNFFLAIASYRGRSLMVEVPVCEDCAQQIQAAQQTRDYWAMAIGAIAAAVVALVIAGRNPALDWRSLTLLGGAVAVAGAVVGLMLGRSLSGPAVARIKMRSAARGTVALWFRHTEFSLKLVDTMLAEQRQRRYK